MGIQLFVSETGEVLPRWQKAFPSALGAPFGKVPNGSVAIAWVRLPRDMTPAQTLDRVHSNLTDIPVVVLSDQPGDDEALACFSAGAKGYCNTHAVPELLERIAQVVAQGGLWIGESLMQRLLQGTARIPLPPSAAPATDWASLLTEREREVALAVAAGESNKEIARRLGITERTIKAHTGAIFAKLKVRDRLQLSLLVHRRPAH